jgi:L-methionine (R)-S-oxide reductase
VIALGDDLRARVAAAPDLQAAGELVVRELKARVAHYSWIGIYWVDGSDLVLGPWLGPEATEHVRIPIGTGVCGSAAASGRTEVVDDVSQDPRYLECFPSTRSEIVVPIVRDGRVIGEIDIDSDRLSAFSEDDARILEEVARALAARA